MTPKEAIKLLEAIKDYTSDTGKKDLSVLQNAVREWEPFLSEPAEIETHPVIDQVTAIEKLSVPVEEKKEWRPTNVVKKPVVKKKKAKKK